MVRILGQLRLRAPLQVEVAVLVPLLRNEQPPIKRTRRFITRRVDRHPDLTVTDLPQRAAVLAGNTDRHLSELRKARVVDHPRLRRQLPAHPPRQRTPHRDRIPRRLVHELLQTLFIPVRQPPGHRLDRLALAIQHQPAHIHLTPTPLILPAHRLEHLRGELHQPPAHPRQLPARQTSHNLHPDLPRRRQPRQGIRPPNADSFKNLTEHY